MARSDKKNRICERCGKKCANPNKLHEHLNRKFKCKPIPIQTPTPQDRRRENPKPIQAPIPQDKNQENDPEADSGPSTQAYALAPPARKGQVESSKVSSRECDMPLNLKECQHLHHALLQADDEAFEEIIFKEEEHSEEEQQDAQEQDAIPKKVRHDRRNRMEELMGYFEGMKKIASIEDHAPEGDIHFKEGLVGRDLERPHQNWFLISKWKAKVPKRSNPAYAFNDMVEGAKKYKEIPYMPKLLASARQEMTRVFQTEFRRKEQIKSAIAVKCIYYKKKKNSGKNFPYIKISEKWHKGEMRALFSENYIDEHLTSSGGKIDKKIEEYLENRSNWILVRIDIVYIKVYTYSQATGGSYEPTSKKLANTKCTINPDNKGLIDSETNALSEKCLQGALGCYFAHQDRPDTDYFE
ncbi:hypothetical protein C1646_767471 [Rhizophagus diaphanus]|nr:hypothetical protein C1646_767471 [Rhizophagus diaphanus] [Rhizophagus sp. MUCL 43196]